jgi:ribonuclease BN (tRNA processing enzyme)
MELIVLGGSAACPNPGQGASAYLLKTSNETILIDCGPNTLLELRKHIEIDQIDRILISHVHSDHTLDLVPLRYGLKYAPGIERFRPTLQVPPEGTGFLQRVASAFSMGTEKADDFWDSVFDVEEYVPDSGITCGDLEIRFMRTNHPVACWAMRFECPEGALVYLADTGPQDDLVSFARDVDVLICEGTYPELESGLASDRPHLSAYEAGVIGREAGAEELILTHLWATAGVDRYRTAAESGFGRAVNLATPGLRMTISQHQLDTSE